MSAAVVLVLLGLASCVALRLALAATRRTSVQARLGPAAPHDHRVADRDRWRPPPWLAVRLERADLPVAPADACAAWLAGTAALLVLAFVLAGPALALVAGAACAVGPLLVLHALDGRADRRVEAALPEALEAVARAMRSAASLPGALAEAARVTPGALGDDLRLVVSRAGAGRRLADALDEWEGRRPLPGIRLAVAALALGAETGGASARAVDGVAETLRGRLEVAAEVRALSSQARLSALVIVVAPLGFSLVAGMADATAADFLLRTPAGLACLVAGLALDGLAALWMSRLSQVEP